MKCGGFSVGCVGYGLADYSCVIVSDAVHFAICLLKCTMFFILFFICIYKHKTNKYFVLFPSETYLQYF